MSSFAGSSLRSITVCHRCTEVYPSSMSCPVCEGDERARAFLALERGRVGVAAEAPADRIRARLQTRQTSKLVLSFSALSLAALSLLAYFL